jgi:hypothetical protein
VRQLLSPFGLEHKFNLWFFRIQWANCVLLCPSLWFLVGNIDYIRVGLEFISTRQKAGFRFTQQASPPGVIIPFRFLKTAPIMVANSST